MTHARKTERERERRVDKLQFSIHIRELERDKRITGIDEREIDRSRRIDRS